MYDHDVRMYGTEGAAKRKRCGVLGIYIDALDKCVYGGAGPSAGIPTASPVEMAPETARTSAKKVAAAVKKLKEVA